MMQSDSFGSSDDHEDPPEETAADDAQVVEEKVGYKRPPKATRFKKGQSGNPGGRPKKRRDFMETLQLQLSGPMQVKVDGEPRWFDSRDAYARALVKSACRGSVRDIGTILGFVDVSDALKIVEQERRYGLLVVPEPAADIDAWERLNAARGEETAKRLRETPTE